LCREEAQQLSSLLPALTDHGVPLYAVVHEELGVKEFQPYFKGEVFLDKERKFYGPVERTMLLSGLFRWSVVSTMLRNRKTGIEGNLKGEGRILGCVFVLGSGTQGVLYEHREAEFGDYANVTDVLEAARQVNTRKSKL